MFCGMSKNLSRPMPKMARACRILSRIGSGEAGMLELQPDKTEQIKCPEEPVQAESKSETEEAMWGFGVAGISILPTTAKTEGAGHRKSLRVSDRSPVSRVHPEYTAGNSPGIPGVSRVYPQYPWNIAGIPVPGVPGWSPGHTFPEKFRKGP